MEMKEILKELENKLQEAKKQAEACEAKEKFISAELDTVRKELNAKKNNISSLELMIESAKEYRNNIPEVVRLDSDTKIQKISKRHSTLAVEPIRESFDRRKHVGACILKLNEYDNVEDRWLTQTAAAKALKWNQSSVSNFMKLDKETQISKKGFALVWEY